MDETIKDDVESTTSTEELDLDQVGDEETGTPVISEEDAKKLEQFPHIVARAKKAEAELKALKDAGPTAPQTSNVPDIDLDSRILKSQGMSDELLNALKKVASVTGKSLIDAQADEVFIAIKNKSEVEEKSSRASLPASKGSGAAKAKEDTTIPNLSAEKHKELWLKNQGR